MARRDALSAPTIALVSLEPWDDTWRRNQHLTAALVRSGAVSHVDFIQPPNGRQSRLEPIPGVRLLSRRRRLPMRLGGAREVAARLRDALADVDLIWINDPVIGVHCLSDKPSLYDVTDDWREATASPRVVRRIINAENKLARASRTVVCSDVLRQRWHDRYSIDADVVHNGVDLPAHQAAVRRELPGDAPHVGYIGTLHSERLDVSIVERLAEDDRIGTVHLVGPDSFDEEGRARVVRHAGVFLHGAVPSTDVPGWMASMDVLVCPHVVTPFTLSLDAIKAYEYQASGRPVVATATSGFQNLAQSVRLASAASFVDEVVGACEEPTFVSRPGLTSGSWDDRARQMAEIIRELTG